MRRHGSMCRCFRDRERVAPWRSDSDAGGDRADGRVHARRQRSQALNGGPQFRFSEAVSFSVPCADQAEVDHYWTALTADGGAAGPCGWLKDRFGVSWQIVPAAVGRMQKEGSPEQVTRMMHALMRMSKPDVAALEAAFAGAGDD
jgi:predicted 3-demethylubiquinone-9 3-methyltransferase (glyoxalase superfamily)